MRYLSDVALSRPVAPHAIVDMLIEDSYEQLLLDLPERYETDDEDRYFERLCEDFTTHTRNPLKDEDAAHDTFPSALIYTARSAGTGPEHALLHIHHTNGETTTFNYGENEFQAVIDGWQLQDIYNSAGIDATVHTTHIVDAPIRLKDAVTLEEPEEAGY